MLLFYKIILIKLIVSSNLLRLVERLRMRRAHAKASFSLFKIFYFSRFSNKRFNLTINATELLRFLYKKEIIWKKGAMQVYRRRGKGWRVKDWDEGELPSGRDEFSELAPIPLRDIYTKNMFFPVFTMNLLLNSRTYYYYDKFFFNSLY